MRYLNIESYESFFEKYSTLKPAEKALLDIAIEEIKHNSADRVITNTEVENLAGIAKKNFYDRGTIEMEGLGKSFASIVPGSIEKDGDTITAVIEHGVSYTTNREVTFKSKVVMDTKEMTYTIAVIAD